MLTPRFADHPYKDSVAYRLQPSSQSALERRLTSLYTSRLKSFLVRCHPYFSTLRPNMLSQVQFQHEAKTRAEPASGEGASSPHRQGVRAGPVSSLRITFLGPLWSSGARAY